jgi:hypothetical protein
VKGRTGLPWPVEHSGESSQPIIGRRVDAGEGLAELPGEARWIGRGNVGETRQAGYQDPWPFDRATTRVSGQQLRGQAAESVQCAENPHLVADRTIAGRELAKNELPLGVSCLDQVSTGCVPPARASVPCTFAFGPASATARSIAAADSGRWLMA